MAPRITTNKMQRMADRIERASLICEQVANELQTVTQNPMARHAWLLRDAARARKALRVAQVELTGWELAFRECETPTLAQCDAAARGLVSTGAAIADAAAVLHELVPQVRA